MPATGHDFLLFELGSSRWALPVKDVREILRAVLPLALPDAPDVVDGVIDLRGELVPVLDARVRLGGEKRPLEANEHFVVARAGERTVALRVDRVLEVVHLRAEQLAPDALATGPWIAGALRLDGGLVLIQDLARFLTEPEANAIGRALDRVGGLA